MSKPTPDTAEGLAALTNEAPDHTYFEGEVVSWDYRTPEGVEARFGVVQEGLDETIPIDPRGERIRLYEPGSGQVLIEEILDDSGNVISRYEMPEDKVVDLPGNATVRLVTPEGQGPLLYTCEFPDGPEQPALQMAARLGIDVATDLHGNPDWSPRLTEPGQEINVDGARYTFVQLDYLAGDKVQASRMIAVIPPGCRTELAYWTQAAPCKQLIAHRGQGELIVGWPDVMAQGRHRLGRGLATLPSGCFYTIESTATATEPLVVSGYYTEAVDWSQLEKYFLAGDQTISAPEGEIPIPLFFRQYAARQ